jgi:hypothetical protein
VTEDLGKQSAAATAAEKVRAIVEAAERSAAELEAAAHEDAARIRAEAEREAEVRLAIAREAAERAAELERQVATVHASVASLAASLEKLHGREAETAEPAAAPVEEVTTAASGATAAPGGDGEPVDETIAGAEAAAARPPDVGEGGGPEGARVIALNMALGGTPREETARYLAENFELDDRDALLDDVYARAGEGSAGG